MMKTAALVLASLLSVPAFAAPACTVADLPNIKGKSYHLARGLLIEAGFIPQLKPTDSNLAPYVDDPRRLFGYGEVSDCSGTGSGGCVYNWRGPSGQPFNVYAVNATGKIAARKNPISCGLNDPYKP